MLSSDKRKHKTLTLKLKAEVLDKLNKGEKINSLAKFYNVGRTTIYDIRKKSEKIERYVKLADRDACKRQTLKSGKNPEVEEALYKWFLKERDKDTHISAELMRRQARFFYKQITNKDDFKASEGWLEKFKHRFGIRFLNLSSDELAETSFVSPFSIINDTEEVISEVEVKIEKNMEDDMVDIEFTEVNVKIENQMEDDMADVVQAEDLGTEVVVKIEKHMEDDMVDVILSEEVGTEVNVKTESQLEDILVETILTEDDSEGGDCTAEEIDSPIEPGHALSSFDICIKWAEQNGVSAEDIIKLRELREMVPKD